LVLEKLTKEDRSIYIVSKSDEDVDVLKGYCKRMQPELRIVGSCSYNEEWDDAAVVNEINSHIPDILLLDLETGTQEKWIMEHLSLLNAKLCIAIGGVAGLIMAQEKKIPRWIQQLHLAGLYHKLVREQSVKKGFRARIFRKKVVQYNNQIEEQNQKDDSK
jgi:exopolysaccharide biosynthesis WecB/TagA/CpsF family protein